MIIVVDFLNFVSLYGIKPKCCVVDKNVEFVVVMTVVVK